MRRIVVVLLATLPPATGSCGREAASDGPALAGERPVSESPAPEPSIRDTSNATVARIYDYGLQFGESRAKIRDALGAPTRIAVRVQENRHVEGATDSLFTLAYPGLTFELNRPGPVEGELLTSVRLVDGGRLPGGLRVGHMTRGELLERLGDPARTREGTRPSSSTTSPVPPPIGP